MILIFMSVLTFLQREKTNDNQENYILEYEPLCPDDIYISANANAAIHHSVKWAQSFAQMMETQLLDPQFQDIFIQIV